MSKVGILVSEGFGAGWSSWGSPEMALDKELVEAFENNLSEEAITNIANKNWPDEYLGGLMDCTVEWVDKGTLFRINEYDGAESLEIMSQDNFIVAQ